MGDSAVMTAIHAAQRAAGLPAQPDLERYANLHAVFDEAVAHYAVSPAFSCLGHTLSYADVARLAEQFASYLQHHTSLVPGDRIALMLPNVLQYPALFWGALRAGLIVVNTNPLYTARELSHQLNDAKVKAIVVLANMAHVVEHVLPQCALQHVIVTELADFHPAPQRWLLNVVARYTPGKMPAYRLPQAISLRDALALGAQQPAQLHAAQVDDIAVLQYTGGTTGVAKGAMLTHRSLTANLQQLLPCIALARLQAGAVFMAPLPLYHIYAFMLHCLVGFSCGAHSVLITNPRDISGFIRQLRKWRVNVMVGLNTLFVALMQHPKFGRLDFNALQTTLSGGMALHADTAQRWQQITGCAVLEGYGLTEASPVVSFNPPRHARVGSIGVALSGTDIMLVDDQGNAVAMGEPGELCVRGPQLMAGYWQHPEATAEMLRDGWLYTGDIAVLHEDGYLEVVDRKKDMLLVSGFNVYPIEIENVLTQHPDIIECAVIGMSDARSGEAVKAFVVPRVSSLTEQEVREFAQLSLAGYKVPKIVEFRAALPKSNVGKVLRRELRQEELRKGTAPVSGNER